MGVSLCVLGASGVERTGLQECEGAVDLIAQVPLVEKFRHSGISHDCFRKRELDCRAVASVVDPALVRVHVLS